MYALAQSTKKNRVAPYRFDIAEWEDKNDWTQNGLIFGTGFGYWKYLAYGV